MLRTAKLHLAVLFSSAIYRIRYGFGMFLRYGSRVLSNIKPVAHIGLVSRCPRKLFHPNIGHQEN